MLLAPGYFTKGARHVHLEQVKGLTGAY